jgi:hypothetical protein
VFVSLWLGERFFEIVFPNKSRGAKRIDIRHSVFMRRGLSERAKRLTLEYSMVFGESVYAVDY